MSKNRKINKQDYFTLPVTTKEAAEIWTLSRDDVARRKRAWVQVQNIVEIVNWKAPLN